MKLQSPPERIPNAASDDMCEADNLLPINPDVRAWVAAINDRLRPSYREADARAGKQQRWHRRAATVAAAAGTLAVVFAIVQLAHLIPGVLPLWTEVVATVLTSVAVVLGIMLSFHEQWHLERHKAERLRLLKFRTLTVPDNWRHAVSPTTLTCEAQAQALENLKPGDVKQWLQQQPVEDPPEVSAASTFQAGPVREMVDYYRRTRLGCQINYFAKSAERFQRSNLILVSLPSWMFFGSLVAALSHFVLDLLGVAHGTASVSLALVFGSATLPILAAGLRTYRSTREPNRNAVRYRAIHTALLHLYRALETETASPSPNYRRIFHDLWWSETLLEFEHREWLRLMTNTDWY
ncbi:MAG: hypothetical protein NT105_23305 [Verrucomicrobia bacterium]|nr:hypothetical protein [Verrucomicrobiota bacterium]